MDKPDAVQILVEHVGLVREAFRQADGDARRAHELLRQTAPAVGGMPWNTFRTRVKLVLEVWEAGWQAGAAAEGQRQSEMAGNGQRQSEMAGDGQRQSEMAGDGQRQSETEVPRRLKGWSINQHRRGYWRAFRKVNGKSKCVYLGMRFDLDAAWEKLTARDKELNKELKEYYAQQGIGYIDRDSHGYT